ncbi:MAG: hypothetical protein WDA03_08590 [Trueperaceae bacterium]
MNTATRVRLVAASALLTVALAACMVPVDYELLIRVHDDGGYTMYFDGTVAEAQLVSAANQNASDSETAAGAADVLAKLQDAVDVRHADHLGDGLFYVSAQQHYSPNETGAIFDFISVTRDPLTLSFHTEPFNDDVKGLYQALELVHNGRLIVRSDLELVGSNGSQGPRGEVWDRQVLEERGAEIVLRLPDQ